MLHQRWHQMAQKRTAHEAFGTGQVSAFAAARHDSLPTRPTRPAVEEKQHRIISATSTITTVVDAAADAAELGAASDTPTYADGDQSAPPPEIYPPVLLSSVQPDRARKVDGGLEISLRVDETATLVGEYHLEVRSGVVAVYGAMLHSGSANQRLYALSSGPLPSIVGKRANSVVHITPASSKISRLETLSPLFRSLDSGTRCSFTFLSSSADDILQRSLSLLHVDDDTRKVLSRINAQLSHGETPRIIAVGAKSSGKSTLNRFLSNMIVTRSGGDKCLFLDLDPGQPEFGPAGLLSLVEVNAPILGPPFTHPADVHSHDFRLLRSHTIAATSFKDDPVHYLNCAADLLSHAREGLPLIVNSCGWIGGIGAATLVEFLAHMGATDIITLGPLDAELQVGLPAQVTIHSIPSRPRNNLSIRTPAELRAMQTMAYFHQKQNSSAGAIKWVHRAISTLRPWLVSYRRGEVGITAVLSYGPSPDPDFLIEVLDGMVVAILVLDGNLIDQALVRYTTKEGIPYILDKSLGCSLPVDVKHSRCVGHALIRGTDVKAHRFHLITPLSEAQIAAIQNEQILLVRGSLDCPEWALLEDVHFSEGSETWGRKNKLCDDKMAAIGRPWLSKRDNAIGVEGSVWRLRHPPTKDAIR